MSGATSHSITHSSEARTADYEASPGPVPASDANSIRPTAIRSTLQVETVVSMIKRRLGSATSGRSYRSRRRDLMLMVLTHNILILWRIDVFYTALPSAFFPKNPLLQSIVMYGVPGTPFPLKRWVAK